MGTEGNHMRGMKLGIALAAFAVVAAGAGALVLPGWSADTADALSGTVASAGVPMEGVVVTVRRSGIATSVVSDAQGRYRFPRGRLARGDYAISIKAAGF